MDYYIYAADVYCPHCTVGIINAIVAAGEAPANPADEHTYDSGDYPKGPYSDAETDTPQNCANCGDYIEGPLTDAGVDYVVEAMEHDINRQHTNSVVRDWAGHVEDYCLTPFQRAIFNHYTEKFNNDE